MNSERFLSQVFKDGSLEVRLPGGRTLMVGDGSTPGVAVAVSDPLTVARILARPSLGVGEAYMDGRLVLEKGTIRDLIELASRNTGHRVAGPRDGPLRRWWKRTVYEANARIAARRNVAHHYDLTFEV